VVDDLERAAQLAVLIGDRVEAMRAGSHDRALGHAVAVERLDIPPGQDLVDVLVAHPAGRIPRARFFLAQDREPDAGRVEAASEGPGDLSVPFIKGRRAADPVQDLDLVEPPGGGEVGDGRHLEVEAGGPVRPG
jgi:hypothetical protein